MNTIYDGFNVESIKKRFDPQYMKRFMAEALMKRKEKREEEEKKAFEQSTISRISLQKE